MAASEQTDLRIGSAGWDYRDWNECVYPRKPGAGFDRLAFLAGHLDVMEVNASFYAPVAAKSAASWLRRTEASGLAFVVKLWGGFTHEQEWPARSAAARWGEVLAPLRESGRLLGVLAQFPFSFRPSPVARQRLQRVHEAFGADRVICEVRHRRWLDEEPRAWIRELGMPLCAIDMPQRGETLPPVIAEDGPFLYLRLHGRNAAAWFDPKAGRDARYDHLYSEAELGGWAERLRPLAVAGRTVVLVGNNHFQGKAVHAVHRLAHHLGAPPRPVPEALMARYPELAAHHRPPPGQLF